MTAQPVSSSGGRVRQVGKVLTRLTVTNRGDETMAARGALAASEIRSQILPEVLVDTGATTLCLPIDVIRQLGLPLMRTVRASTATGVEDLELYEDAKITIEGRTATFECLALPAGSQPLLGVIPLERLGLEPDLQNQRLRLLPETGRDTYFLVL